MVSMISSAHVLTDAWRIRTRCKPTLYATS